MRPLHPCAPTYPHTRSSEARLLHPRSCTLNANPEPSTQVIESGTQKQVLQTYTAMVEALKPALLEALQPSDLPLEAEVEPTKGRESIRSVGSGGVNFRKQSLAQVGDMLWVEGGEGGEGGGLLLVHGQWGGPGGIRRREGDTCVRVRMGALLSSSCVCRSRVDARRCPERAACILMLCPVRCARCRRLHPQRRSPPASPSLMARPRSLCRPRPPSSAPRCVAVSLHALAV